MRRRCNNPNASNYKHYGAKGIKVCERWQDSFENFYEDMGDRPAGTTLDRKDVTLGYFKDNCRWSNPSLQSYNQGLSSDNTSGVKGVCEVPGGRWQAYLNYDKQVVHSSVHATFEEAVKARKDAEAALADALEKEK